MQFAEAVRSVEDVLGNSPVLRRLGYATCSRVLKFEVLPATCRFTLQTSGSRRLAISFYYQQDGNHFFTIEVFNTVAASSFLLDEWLAHQGRQGDPRAPYPYILSSYSGTTVEKLAGFLLFLETHLASADLARVLSGGDWVDIPYDWGATK